MEARECTEKPNDLQRKLTLQKIINELENKSYYAPVGEIALFMKGKNPDLIMQKR
jgi:hypothetical protein